MKLLTILLINLFLIGNLFAENKLDNKVEFDYPYKDNYQIKEYVKDSGKKIDFDLANKLNTDIDWLKGNDYLTNIKYKQDLTSKSVTNSKQSNKRYKGTNLSLESYKMSRKLIAKHTTYKYKEALEAFYKSMKVSDNPVASYQGLTILFDYYANNIKVNKKYRKLFTEHLVKHNICWGYLELGNIYKKGIYIKKNIEHAFKVYGQGLPVCKKTAFKTWQDKQIRSGYYGLKRFIK